VFERRRKKPAELYCVCHKPNDRKKYWQCEECEKWFHPAYIKVLEANDNPTPFICTECLEKKVKEFEVVSVPKMCLDKDDEENSEILLVNAEKTTSMMTRAFARGWQVTESTTRKIRVHGCRGIWNL